MSAINKRNFKVLENRIAADAVAVAYRIHSEIGPGLLESAYAQLFCYLLRQMGHKVETEVPVPIEFEGLRIATGFRADVIIDDVVIVELKSVRATEDVFLKQLLTYVRLAKKEAGIAHQFWRRKP